MFRKVREHPVWIRGVGIPANKFSSPLERSHFTVVIEHCEVPLAFVHVSFQHSEAILLRIYADSADKTEAFFFDPRLRSSYPLASTDSARKTLQTKHEFFPSFAFPCVLCELCVNSFWLPISSERFHAELAEVAEMDPSQHSEFVPSFAFLGVPCELCVSLFLHADKISRRARGKGLRDQRHLRLDL